MHSVNSLFPEFETPNNRKLDSLLTPGEILAAYPEISKVWTRQDLGRLLQLGLVQGKKVYRSSVLNHRQVKAIFDNRIINS